MQAAANRDLTAALARTAPRSCSVRYLLAKGSEAPEFTSPVLSVDHLPLRANVLPLVWQSGATARPLDGEFVHATTPMIPLRSRGDDDGSQTSVMIPHSVAWDAPELLPGNQARLFRSFTKRAVRLADVILTPSHATASVIQEHYGADLPVQVLQLAAPREFLRQEDGSERRAALGLPPRYAVTTANPGEHGRLEWVLDAMRRDPELPPLVIIDGLDPLPADQAAARNQAAKGAAARAASARAAAARAEVQAGATAEASDGAGQSHLDPTTGAVEPGLPADPSLHASEQGDDYGITAELRDRVVIARPRELADVGAILSGAGLLLCPQSYAGTGYTVLGALASSVPVLHAGHPATAELAFDGGLAAPTAAEFEAEYRRLFTEPGALARLTVLARDRSRGFSWNAAAWQLWETHANL